MSDDAVRLHIRLMGTPEAFAGGSSLTLNQLKSRGLLFYLAVTGQSHTRDHLATLLWGESGQSEAYHSLRSCLYHLRKALQAAQLDEVLISESDLLRLDPSAYRCDVIEFRRLLALGDEGSLSQAVVLWKGSLLQGFSIPEAPMFEDWVQMESTRLSQACFEALDCLADSAEKREAWAVTIGYVKQMIQIDPLSEIVQQRLMDLYLKQGDVGLVLRQYRQFENKLKQELGIAPNSETRRLYENALRQQVGVTFIPVSSHTSMPVPNVLPFVGRDDLIHELSSVSEDVTAGRGVTVLIQGEGGIGKSRLIHEFASRLIFSSQPWIILQGACSPFDDLLSHGPFIEALQNGMTDDLDDLLNESTNRVPDARGRFFWRVLRAIRSLTQSAPLLLFIEDLQWGNSSTLNLFGFLSMRLHHLPVMLVGTVQHADAIPALQRLITLGRRRHELRLLSLTPLAQKAIADLLLASNVNPRSIETLAEWLNAKSSGNPFLLSEILAQLRTEKILKAANDGWQVDTTQWLRWRTTFSLPETAHDLVGWRLANISPEARNLLDVLAVASQPVPESVQLFVQSALRVRPTFSLDEENRKWVIRICQLTEGMPLGIELAAAWVRVLSCQQIAQEIESSLDFLKASARDITERHRSLRAALDHSWNLLAAEEKTVFKRLSVFRGGFRREAAQAAAGADLEILTSLLDKSLLKRIEEERYDLHELVRQYAESQLQSDSDEDFRAHERHSNYYAAQLEEWGKEIASPKQMKTLSTMDLEIDNVRLAWNWMVAHQTILNIQKSVHCVWRFHDIRGRFQEGEALMKQAATMLRTLDEAESTPDEERSILLGRVLAEQGYFCAYLGRYEEAHALLGQSLNLLRAQADPAALAHTLAVLGYMQIRLGEFQEAKVHAEESLALYRALGDHDRMLYCLITLSYIHLSQGAYEEAHQLAGEGLAISREILGDPLAMEHCLLSLSAASSYLGQYGESRRWAEEAFQIGRALNHRSGIGEALKWLGLISSKVGDSERAEALLRQSIVQFREIGDRTLIADVLVELGVAIGASGGASQARQYLLDALQTATETRADHTALQALVEIADLEGREGNTALALELAMYCLHHPFSKREVTDRAELLHAQLAAKLTPQQIEALKVRAKTRTLESLVQELLLARDVRDV